MKNNKILRVEGKVQNYDWGGKTYIPNLVSQSIDENETYAEYWLGAHLKAPSIVKIENDSISLDHFLSENKIENLGKKVTNEFGKLPYLFKVLDVNKMLSIQVHPSIEAAIKGYQTENEKGIALTAKNRNYKDQNHKPEIMVALSDFWLLHGFLERDKLIKNLKETKELSFLMDTFLEEGYLGLYKKVMEYSQEEVNEVLKPLVDRIYPKYLNNELEKSSPAYWSAKSLDNKNSQNIDRGIFSIYFFNILNVSKGEAVFQDAGVPHAYLEGKNMELMANSDNVLRGGLTSKHIDVEELIKNTKFEETIPEVLSGFENKSNGEIVFKTKAKDFELSKIELKATDIHNSISNSVEILIALNGAATVTQNNESLSLNKGESVLIKANTAYKINTTSEVEIYKAGVPK
ncbi:mannose-6-phosphate isomerase, class I [Polaribacter sp. Hel1_85]|uniref:mannose-6-phosphate isomerase, class I n=1 Tax=Polaribacter sp. Hel1_85 TaxID=1250005 RepID=UPI00052B523E|nr:mannose-6-phosphate isomerase, class I [Polaribacter sp. Hel1_85]KGL63823.1 mannose-6-phosphate isomerase [Polaribacter sp. Hel1_85]